MRRVLLLMNGLNHGGAEQLLLSSAPYLDAGRFAYEVAYLLADKDGIVGALREAGLPVRCLHGERGLGWIARLRALVRDRRVDLVHVHAPYPAIGARLGLRRRRCPVVYTEHSEWRGTRRVKIWANSITFARNDHVFAVADHVRTSIRYPWPLAFRRMPTVETLYYGLDPEAVRRWGAIDGVRAELGVSPEAPLVGCVANFTREKAHANLIHAADFLRRSFPAVRLALVGEGRLQPEARRLTHELGLDDVVIFTGRRKDAPRIAGAFDVFALASEQEGLSIAALEAMAQGVPVAATRVGGLQELVRHGREGYLVRSGDPRALAEAVGRMLRDEELRASLGSAARARAGEFDVRRAVRRTEELYEELLSA